MLENDLQNLVFVLWAICLGFFTLCFKFNLRPSICGITTIFLIFYQFIGFFALSFELDEYRDTSKWNELIKKDKWFAPKGDNLIFQRVVASSINSNKERGL